MILNCKRLAPFAVLSVLLAGRASAAFTFTPVAIGFVNPISVDFHAPTGKVILSTNYPDGDPYNFELVGSDGARVQFSSISGLTNEVYIGAVRTTHAGFVAGELFTGTGVPGQIARISPDGTTALIPWVTLPGELGVPRGALHVDETGVFGGDLVVVTETGAGWRLDAAGNATYLGTAGMLLEGLMILPHDPRYGPWAGKAVSCNEGGGGFFAFDPTGAPIGRYDLGIPSCENLNLIPAGQFFYAVDFVGQTLWSASPDQFTGMVGDMLVGEEEPGNLWHVSWNPLTDSFDKELLLTVAQFEGAAFVPAALPLNHPPTLSCPAEVAVCARSCGTEITVAVGLADEDGDALAVTWLVNGVTTVHELAAGATGDQLTFVAGAALPGASSVEVRVDDGAGGSATCAVPVTVKSCHDDGHDRHHKDHKDHSDHDGHHPPQHHAH